MISKRKLIPLYKLPRIAAVFSLMPSGFRCVCPSCTTPERFWSGILDDDIRTTNGTYVWVCLRCGQVSKEEEQQPYFSIRIQVSTAREARTVRYILRGRTDLWGGGMYFHSDGALHLQWGSYNKTAIDHLTDAFRAAGFVATWDLKQKVAA